MLEEAGGGKLDDVELTEADMEDITGGTGGSRRRKRENEEASGDNANNNEDEEELEQEQQQAVEDASQDMVGDSLAPFIFT
jgi:hypothetical protein